MEYKQVVVLEAVFDDSDIQTDYFHRDRTMFEWFVSELEGKRVTERKLWRALKKLPTWLQTFSWKFRKGEKYSMSDHYYGQLRADEGTGLKVDGQYTYSHYERSVRFILTVSSIGVDNKQPIPQSYEEMKRLIEQKQRKWEEQRQRTKEHMKKVMPQIIQDSYAIIDGRGFHVLTQKEKDKMKQKYTA